VKANFCFDEIKGLGVLERVAGLGCLSHVSGGSRICICHSECEELWEVYVAQEATIAPAV